MICSTVCRNFGVVFQHGHSAITILVFLSDEGPTLEMLNFTFHIGSTQTFLYFDLYLNTLLLDKAEQNNYMDLSLVISVL